MPERQIIIDVLRKIKTTEYNSNPEKKIFNTIYNELNHLGYKKHLDNLEIKEFPTSILTGNHIISQPYGSQNAPDIQIIKNGNIFLNIEVKSSKKNNHPMWNGGKIKENYIYIFMKTGKDKKGTYFLGKDTQWILFHSVYSEFHKKMKKLQTGFNDMMISKTPDCKFYMRAMFNDTLNYFNVDETIIKEQNVIDFINSL